MLRHRGPERPDDFQVPRTPETICRRHKWRRVPSPARPEPPRPTRSGGAASSGTASMTGRSQLSVEISLVETMPQTRAPIRSPGRGPSVLRPASAELRLEVRHLGRASAGDCGGDHDQNGCNNDRHDPTHPVNPGSCATSEGRVAIPPQEHSTNTAHTGENYLYSVNGGLRPPARLRAQAPVLAGANRRETGA